MFRNKSDHRILPLFVFCTLLISGCGFPQKGSDISEGDPVMSSLGNVINLEQGWTVDIQQAFYLAMSQLTVETVLFFQEIPGNKALV